MTTYFEYGVNLTDNQKRSLASAINNRTPLTLRIKHSNLSGNDELMLTKTQHKRIQKSLANGTGVDIKISKTQIRKVAKQGGNLFTSLASLLPYAVKGLSKAVPALATGAVSALGSLGIDKIFGKGINIPKKYFPMLPYIVNELTQSQIDQINKTTQSGGRLVIKPTRKQIEGGFLGTLASIGIPIAIELVSKMLVKVLKWIKYHHHHHHHHHQAMFIFLKQEGNFQCTHHHFTVTGVKLLEWERKLEKEKRLERVKKKKGRGLLLGKNSPFNAIPILGTIL